MDYKEKYEMALERAKKVHQYSSDLAEIKRIEDIFPELKESEDELTWLTKYIEEEAYSLSIDIRDNEDRIKLKKLQKAFAWLEKQGQEKYLSEPIKDYQGECGCWNNAHDFRPKHLQRCLCFDKYMGGVYCYVYDDISKYWCTQTTEEHDPDGDNHISDYADYRVTAWMPLPDISFYPPQEPWYKTHGVERVNPVTCETLSTMFNVPHVSGTKGKKSPLNSEEEDNEK